MIILPTRNNVMKLLSKIHSLPELSREVKQRLQWAKRQLHNGGSQYDLQTHLEAKKTAAEVARSSPSILRQFLSQTEPPQWCVQPGPGDESETDSESGWCSSGTEQEEPAVSVELASLVYDSGMET